MNKNLEHLLERLLDDLRKSNESYEMLSEEAKDYFARAQRFLEDEKGADGLVILGGITLAADIAERYPKYMAKLQEMSAPAIQAASSGGQDSLSTSLVRKVPIAGTESEQAQAEHEAKCPACGKKVPERGFHTSD
jgi:hypothetical protein